MSVRWCVRACVRVFNNLLCVCFRMCVSEYIFLHELKHPLTDEHDHTHAHMHTRTHACVCVCVCVCVNAFVLGFVCACVCS